MTDDEIEKMLREAIDRSPAEEYRKVAALAWLDRQTTILREFRELGLLVDDDALSAALNERAADEVWIKAETKIAKLAKLRKAREKAGPGRGTARAKAGRAKRHATS